MTDQPHKDRSHSVYSASATARNVVCYGAIAMSSLCEDVEREAAAWGTTCHEAAERCFREQKDAVAFIGQEFKVGKFTFTFDEEMANTTQTYVDYVHETSVFGIHPTWIEKNFSLSALNPPLEAGGTADAVIYNPDEKLLEVADLKAGRGVTVDVVGNPQGRFYAIGAVLALPDVKPTHVRVTIVQPRVGDGLPKSDTFHVTELLDWTSDLLVHMGRSKQALDEFDAIGADAIQRDVIDTSGSSIRNPPANRILFDEWAEKWLTPGQCTFCQAKPVCPALRRKALAAMPEFARTWHEDTSLTTPPALSNSVKSGSVEELERDLDNIDTLKEWIGARASYAKMLAEQGTKFERWGLVDSVGNRKYAEKDQAKLAATLIEKFKLTDDQVYEKREVKSPAQMEKVLKGAAKKEFIAADKTLWVRPITGKNLVRLDRTDRPPAKSVAETFHEDVN